MSKPLCLVTGACGFMGTHMVEVLTEAGYPVRGTDLVAAYQEDNRTIGRFPSVLKKLGVEFIPSDLADPDSLKPVVQDVGYVFHLAAVFNYSAPWAMLEKVNIEGTRALMEHLRYQKSFKKIVFWGAGGVYDIKNASMPLTEESPIRPGNNYLKSKHRAEMLVLEMAEEHKMGASILRPTTVYGPRGVYGGGQMLMAAASMGVAACPMNWNFRIPFVHARDVCRAALHLAEKADTDGQVYNVNDDSELTNVEFFEFVAGITGHVFVKILPIPVAPLKGVLRPVAKTMQWISANITKTQSPLEADTVEYLGLDIAYSSEKLKKTGFEFQYPDARHGIADTIAWYQRNAWI